VLFIAGLVTAGLTAFYTFRAYFLTFWGELRTPPEAGDHVHESPPVMTVPLRILAVGAVGLGIVLEPFTHWLSRFMEVHWMDGLLPLPEGHHHNIVLMLGSSVFALGGIALAWYMYVLQPGFADRLAKALSGAFQLSLNKFHVDELYYFFLVQPLNGLAQVARLFDQYVVDGLVDLVGHMPGLVGRKLQPIQNGLVQFYALAMMLGLTVFLGALVARMIR
jgi:NADH-quinone oxidoreductase subunit L